MDGLLGRRLNGVSLAALAAFSLHQLGLAMGFYLLLLDSYLDPLCTVPVVLGLPSMLARRIWPRLLLSWGSAALFTLALSLAFEWWIPSFDARFTRDPWDALAYALGAAIWRMAEPQSQ
jgi:hypothetical protein